jgi:FdrA protein
LNVVRVRPGSYVDSVLLMSATRAMETAEGVERAAALMCTPSNREALAREGFDPGEAGDAGANDLVLAVRADSEEHAAAAMRAAQEALDRGAERSPEATETAPRTLEEARTRLGEASVAVISVPGEYATLEAHRALSLGMHVLLFSDNVPIEAEVELKRRAAQEGLLVMGPGAGTAILSGIGLGFANAVRNGPVGVVSAAGTGAQEVTSLLHRWGSGVSHAIGVGGRDLSRTVGGTMTCAAIEALRADPGTRALLVVSKPPSPEIAARVLEALAGGPAVAAFIGLATEPPAPPGVRLARTLEEAALLALDAVGEVPPRPSEGVAAGVEEAAAGLGDERRAVRGLFAGGTLCYEAMVVLGDRIGPVHSNTPLERGRGLPAPTGAHVCLDLGEEEYTRGRPHPMIDPEPRAEAIAQAGDDASVAAVLVDVVLGHGAHADPASVLAPACETVARRPDGPAVVAYVLGTEDDPQGLDGQRARLAEAGCLVAPTGARAALMAAALATREPHISEAGL